VCDGELSEQPDQDWITSWPISKKAFFGEEAILKNSIYSAKIVLAIGAEPSATLDIAHGDELDYKCDDWDSDNPVAQALILLALLRLYIL
jgi:hypothetical protein